MSIATGRTVTSMHEWTGNDLDRAFVVGHLSAREYVERRTGRRLLYLNLRWEPEGNERSGEYIRDDIDPADWRQWALIIESLTVDRPGIDWARVLDWARNTFAPQLPALRPARWIVRRAVTVDDVMGYPPTDSGNGELFTRLYDHVARYDHRRDRWLIWQGDWWEDDTDATVERWALDAARVRQQHASQMDGDLKKQHFQWGTSSESQAKIAATLTRARTMKPISDPGVGWDSDPDLLGVANGVIELRTGTLRRGHQDDRITLHSDLPYYPDAPAPRWERFMSEIFGGSAELADYMHRYIGYCLTGHTSDQSLLFCYGVGGNGKSTLLDRIRRILGQHGHHTAMSTLLHVQKPSNGPTTELAALQGKRLVTSIESREGAHLNEALIKALTGNDPLTARHLYEREITFTPEAKFFLAFNHKPRVSDDSFGFWRRVRFIPFEQTFDPAAEPDLHNTLDAEMPGILAWAVQGCLAWRKYGLTPPARVISATKQYREESDPLADFISDKCETGATHIATAADLYKAYRAWAEDQGMREREQLSNTSFGRRLSERFEKKRDRRGVYYTGIRVSEIGGQA